jgi:hypothetical protein
MACAFGAAFSSCASYRSCPAPLPERVAALPARLSQTGLMNGGVISTQVHAYEPAFALWSDGAEKRRWVYLPSGAEIDKHDMNDWRFPAGTKLWKEFARNGKPLETRIVAKVGPGDDEWAAASYVWLPDGTDAVLTPSGADDVNGTTHDVPSASQCRGCHGGRRSFVLGYSAVQLGDVRVPGNETERAALGYLHANCAHCHNQARPESSGPRCYDPHRKIDFAIPAEPIANVVDTPTYKTAIPAFVMPGRPDDSRVMQLVSRRGFLTHMPPLATEQVDTEHVTVLRRWIEALPVKDGK